MDKYAINQLSVFVENKKGELNQVTSILSDENISIKNILLVDSTDFGILRLLLEDTESAKEALSSGGFVAKVNKVFAVRMQDKIGSFHQVVGILTTEDINILYTYAYREKDQGVFVFKVDNSDFDKAIKVLQENQLELVENEHLCL